jgi:hypothetical protein
MPHSLPLLSAAALNQAALTTRTRVTLRGGVKVSMPRTADSLAQLESAIDESTVKVTVGERTLAIPGMYVALCQEHGINPADLHDCAAEIIAQSTRAVRDKLAVLQEARHKSAAQGVSLAGIKRCKDGDYDSIRHFDETAEHVAQQYAEYFGGEDPENKLYDMLSAGNPEPIHKARAFERAFAYLQGKRCAGPVSEEPIPD